METISDNRRFFELVASIVTGLGKILFINILNQRLVFIIAACLFWIGYLIVRNRQDSRILKYWGFTKTNFEKSFMKLLPYALISIIIFWTYGIYFDAIILNWHILIIMLIYPIWGVIQQYLVVGLLAGNLNDQKSIKISKPVIIILTAILFSIVHYPSIMLITGTFILGIIYSIEYLKERNLWVLGIYHGWLACFYFFFVLTRDPFNELFENLW